MNINDKKSSLPNESPHSDKYRTCDLMISSFLVSRDVKLATTEVEGARPYFIFTDPNIDALVFAFHQGAAVNVQRFIGAMRSLKELAIQRTRGART